MALIAPPEKPPWRTSWGDDELQLLHGVEGNRLRIRLTARRSGVGQSEDVVVYRTVDLDGVVAVIGPPRSTVWQRSRWGPGSTG
jgi:hypothetical protein